MSDEMAMTDNGVTVEGASEGSEEVPSDVGPSLDPKEAEKDQPEPEKVEEPAISQDESSTEAQLRIDEDSIQSSPTEPTDTTQTDQNTEVDHTTEPSIVDDKTDSIPEITENVTENNQQKIPELQVQVETDIKTPEMDVDQEKTIFDSDTVSKAEPEDHISNDGEKLEDIIAEVNKGIKRRASTAFGDENEEFKGFDAFEDVKMEIYGRVVERLEAEVSAATKSLTPLRNVMATPIAPPRASKRPRTDTDGSRPSSALSSRSDENTDVLRIIHTPVVRIISVPSSPAQRRRATVDMSSPVLRVPLEKGWKRELVYRATTDNNRKNADIYYYTPQGKKLRSTREVSEHLKGTGLTLENFSFFKEPLGVDDPEREIIRDAKMMRRVESPVCSAPPPAEGKRTPKPKPPKGVSPEPVMTSPPAKIKVKSVGSRLSGSTPVPSPVEPKKQTKKPQPATTPGADNNNTATWKKPRDTASPPPAAAPAPPGVAQGATQGTTAIPTPTPTAEPQAQSQSVTPRRQLVQPCSMSCGRGAVPSLSCAACLCLYHPVCAGYTNTQPPQPFLCKNCRKSSPPPLDPPPIVSKSGVASSNVPAPVPRRVPVPRQDKRVLLRMKAAGGSEGERVWSVSGANTQPPAPQAPIGGQAGPPAVPGPPRGGQAGATLPQSLALLNGRRFIVVPRTLYPAV